MARFEYLIDITEEGKAVMYNRAELKTWLGAQAPGRYYVTITNKRTNPQNKLWHVWLGMLSNFIGEDKDKLEVDLLRHVGWFREETNEQTGETWKEVKSMKEATIKECKELMEKVQIFVAQYYEFDLPWPDEQLDINLNL